MAYAKKTAKNEAYQKLKTDLKEGNPLGNAYLFYGEESYLREYYLGEIRKRLIPAGFEEFNYHALEGKDLTAQSLTEMAEAMPMMAERPTLRVFDVNLRQDFFSREVLEESMARCNILKISDEEAPRVAGCLTGCPAADPGGLCRELLDRRENLEMVILTEGAEGSRVFTRNRISAYVIPRGERVRPVDTVGAGDSFTAAFCAMLAAGYDIWPAQAFASKVAAFVCSCAGATPEYPAAAKTEFSGNL